MVFDAGRGDADLEAMASIDMMSRPVRSSAWTRRLFYVKVRYTFAGVGADVEMGWRAELSEPVSGQPHSLARNVAAADAAILWRLTKGNQTVCRRIYQDLIAAVNDANIFELRPGMPDLLARIHSRGVLLGLAANQPPSTIERLDSAGVGHFFTHRKVSATIGFSKPDPRLFLEACAYLQVDPASCLMVGDRIDNDIAPAKALGMRTVLFRTGRHRLQMPRSAQEVPDADVASVEELDAAIFREIDG